MMREVGLEAVAGGEANIECREIWRIECEVK
jgi:hypothetical protein